MPSSPPPPPRSAGVGDGYISRTKLAAKVTGAQLSHASWSADKKFSTHQRFGRSCRLVAGPSLETGRLWPRA